MPILKTLAQTPTAQTPTAQTPTALSPMALSPTAQTLKLLVLVPHRDAILSPRAWSAALFAAGFDGAWSFPRAAPLAILSRFLSAGELKRSAWALREQTLAGEREGKIKTGPASRAFFPDSPTDNGVRNAAVFGPILDLEIPDSFFEIGGKVLYRFSPLVLGAALTRGTAPPPEAPPQAMPRISFRAAALANMAYRPLFAGNGVPAEGVITSAYSFEWKIGRLYWLPSPAKPSSPASLPSSASLPLPGENR
jgi:hypothetical protein